MPKQTVKLSKKQQEIVEEEVEKEVEKHLYNRLSKHLYHRTTKFGALFKQHSSTAIVAAFGFLIALVWRDLIVKLVKESTKIQALQSHPYLAELYTAIIVTIIAIIGIALISNWSKKEG